METRNVHLRPNASEAKKCHACSADFAVSEKSLIEQRRAIAKDRLLPIIDNLPFAYQGEILGSIHYIGVARKDDLSVRFAPSAARMVGLGMIMGLGRTMR